MKYTDTKNAPAAIGPYSQAISTGNLLFTSGQIPLDPQTGAVVGEDISSQAHQVMKNLGAVLEANGIGYGRRGEDHLLPLRYEILSGSSTTVYAQYFTGKPARSCVAVKELPKNVLCEVEAIAQLG